MDAAPSTHRGPESRNESWASSRSARPGAGGRARKRPSFQARARAPPPPPRPPRQQQLVSSYNLAWPALRAYLRELWPGEAFADECCRNDEFVLDLPEPLTKEQIAKISELRKPPPDEGDESE